ncbi:MAG: TonB-dependent receptor [Bacteroidota bacterium]
MERLIDFSAQDMTIAEALKALSEEVAISIAFSDQFFDPQVQIDRQWRQKEVQIILNDLLKNTGIAYRETGGQVLLFRLPKRQVPSYTISGFIESAEDGERLISASIYSPKHQKGTFTNEYGFYSLTLPAGTLMLSVSYLGATVMEQSVDLKANQRLNMALKSSVNLEEVVVSANDTYEDGQTTDPSTRLAIEQIDLIPDLGGEPDILRLSQTLPGIQSGSDGLGGLYVRGGNADQNLMLLDGVPVYNATHLLGFFSIYNASAIRSARLWKGAFPARYGGRLSSVFDVRTREGNNKEYKGEAQLGLLSAKATVEGPFAQKKGAVLLTARRSHSNFLLGEISQKVFYPGYEEEVTTNFYDFNAKVNYTISEKDRLYVSYFRGEDKFGLEAETIEEGEEQTFDNEVFWNNDIASFRWNHLYGSKLFSNLTLTYSNYEFSNALLEQVLALEEENDEEDYFFFYHYFTNIQDQAINIDFDYHPIPDHYIRFGAGFTRHRFEPGAVSLQELDGEEFDYAGVEELVELYEAPELKAREAHVYVEDELQLSPRWQANIGLRISSFWEEGESYFFPEPRISTQFRINKKWLLDASWIRMVQYLHRINPSGLSTPDDIWVPTTDVIRPQESWQGELGLTYFGSQAWQLTWSTYYKSMKNLLSLPQSQPFLSFDQNLEEELLRGSGNSYGIELLLKREFGKMGGWLNYTLAWSQRQFTGLNQGKIYPFQFDRRHQINAYWFYRFNDRFNISANWTLGSANPLLLVSEDSFEEEVFPDQWTTPGQKNQERSNHYHRLDIGARYTWSAKRFSHQIKLSVYNLYNRDNAAFHRLDLNEDNARLETEPIHLLPILPSFTYRLEF